MSLEKMRLKVNYQVHIIKYEFYVSNVFMIPHEFLASISIHLA